MVEWIQRGRMERIERGPIGLLTGIEVYYATSSSGYRRGPYRAIRAEAEADCPTSGEVRSACGSTLLQAKRIQWDLVDDLCGIEQVWLHTHDLRIQSRAQGALRLRDRGVPWR